MTLGKSKFWGDSWDFFDVTGNPKRNLFLFCTRAEHCYLQDNYSVNHLSIMGIITAGISS